MTSCDNHKTSASFASTKMTEENKNGNKEENKKTSDLSFLQKLGQRPNFAEKKNSRAS